MAAEALAQVLRPLKETFSGQSYDGLLVGLDAADDAAVYQVADDLAIVVTLDFFTPIVDDPYAYGAIAAANSLSDLYAMGAKPILALNIAALPKTLPVEISSEIMRGGAEKALEAGIPVVGGHSIQDQEPKYGLVALGTIHPQKMTRKQGAKPGDSLLLSKPLGTGVVTTGLMNDSAAENEIAIATQSMMKLNRDAAEIAHRFGATAVTDITGFSLLGHAWEMAEKSAIGLRIHYDALPWLPGAERLGELWTFPGGAHDNRLFYGANVRFAPALQEWQQLLCFDPQTSGGLLIALAPDQAQAALKVAHEQGQALWHIGEVVEGNDIEVIP